MPGVGDDDRFARAAAKIVAVARRELPSTAEGVLDIADIERVHDMRVATRRLRAALEVFEPCFPRKRYRRALREVKALADALGERRDRDVTIAALDGFATGSSRRTGPGSRASSSGCAPSRPRRTRRSRPEVSPRSGSRGSAGRLRKLAAAAEAR